MADRRGDKTRVERVLDDRTILAPPEPPPDALIDGSGSSERQRQLTPEPPPPRPSGPVPPQPASPAPDPFLGATLLGQFQILRRIGKGGFGAVYLADQIGVDRKAVVKVVNLALTQNPTFLLRFHREARVLALLDHHHLCKLYAFGEYEGQPFLAMEYGGDRTLAEEIRRAGRLDEKRALSIAAQICDALAEAHRQGVVHRDLKPANVLLSARGSEDWVKVVDVGIAKLMGGGEEVPDAALTVTGTIVGTPQYFSPEQARGVAVDGRSDLYSLGVVLFEMLTGKLPISAATPIDFVRAHNVEPPTSPRHLGVEVSRVTEAILFKTLAKVPEARFQSAAELAEALRAAAVGKATPGLLPPSPKRTGFVAAAVTTAVVAALGVTAALMLSRRGAVGPVPRPGPVKAAAVPVDVKAPARPATVPVIGRLLFRAPGTTVFVDAPGVDPKAADPEVAVSATGELVLRVSGRAVDVRFHWQGRGLELGLRATGGDTLEKDASRGTAISFAVSAAPAMFELIPATGATIPLLCRFSGAGAGVHSP